MTSKRSIAGLLGVCLLVSAGAWFSGSGDLARAAAYKAPVITINGTTLVLEAVPYIKQGRVMVPLRGVAEGMGAAVTWDQAARTATVKRGAHKARLTAGSTEAVKDGLVVTLDAPAEIHGGRIYIPLRFSAESLGGTVSWNAAAGAAAIGLPLASDVAQGIIQDRADKVLSAIKNKDWAAVADLSSQQGVRFSPYGFVDIKNDRVLSQSAIPKAPLDSAAYLWGAYDGSGDPIMLDFAQYYEKFIYSSDFAAAPQIGYNMTIGTGNTLNNAQQVYPGAIIVEYHYDGFDPQYAGIDWQSLRLVFGEEGSQWVLVGIIHDQWTI